MLQYLQNRLPNIDFLPHFAVFKIQTRECNKELKKHLCSMCREFKKIPDVVIFVKTNGVTCTCSKNPESVYIIYNLLPGKHHEFSPVLIFLYVIRNEVFHFPVPMRNRSLQSLILQSKSSH